LNAAIGYFLFFIFVLGLMTYGFSKLFESDTSGVSRNENGEIVYFGSIDQDRVDKAMALYRPGDRLLIRSSGGDLDAGMMFGDFINKRNMSVEVIDYCISSCANYVFLAGSTKILNPNSLVIFHGGPKQANFRSLMEQAYSESVEPGKVFGREGYEAIISTTEARRRISMRNSNEQSQCGKEEVLTISGKCEHFGPEQRLHYIIYLENELYARINPRMDKNIPYYGQQGRYESTYKAYEYFGFYYSLDSLANLNVTNVDVKGDNWQPQTNPLFQGVYEVTIE
jgi:hypothetical protein